MNTQARIQDFGQGGPTEFGPQGPWAQNLLKIGVSPLKLPENCMIMKKSWGQGGRAPPGSAAESPSQGLPACSPINAINICWVNLFNILSAPSDPNHIVSNSGVKALFAGNNAVQRHLLNSSCHVSRPDRTIQTKLPKHFLSLQCKKDFHQRKLRHNSKKLAWKTDSN